ncbi:uncharacterized protein LOC131008190 [Salvia miltiorrhiza]|uniref:uncharacterized protein LOC131008190 n=1 Tax=Salvia miltiorrhiza TaxID=226208 RepID=UPI0025ACA9AD|nr:uncharacterized protein LOC131008190 [Salvia miltiorrhiza]
MDAPQEENSNYLRPSTINVASNVGTYYKTKYLKMVRKVLNAKGGQPLVDRFLSGCFGHLLDWNPGSKCAMAVHHVVSRQIRSNDNGLWFFINGSRLNFSERDYALVTWLNFGETDFDTRAHHDLRNVEVFRKFCCGQRTVKVETLVDLFENYDIDDQDGSLLLRVAHVLVLYGMLLGYEPDKNVADWVWALVNDLDAFAQFPWAAYSYQLLCQYVNNFSTHDKYKLYGPVWALHVWSLEIIPELRTAVGTHLDGGAHPRCLRWRFRSRPTVSDLRLLFEQERVCQTYWRCCMFGTRLNLAVPSTYDSFAAWEVPEGICKMIKGECGSSMAQSWMGASQVSIYGF